MRLAAFGIAGNKYVPCPALAALVWKADLSGIDDRGASSLFSLLARSAIRLTFS
ncbi:hypothetical protein AM571_CH00546 [Rhizobium etli 8C-3]|uniref:Uncharacterized protein n=1 Tax=Rhizobium etli 8C-3 TaxID=538025 RepID=A0A1L5NZR5_RHIET|nr:hypothetical protein AM571_CH00546 [Rhizobium etli 8C-3]